MQNRQLLLDRNESNPMLMGLLELVREDSQEMQKSQQELNKAMEENAEISGLMENHKNVQKELQASHQKKIAELMMESETIKALVEEHKKEMAELQVRQRQAIEKAMSEEQTIVEAMKQQRQEMNTLRMQQQKELNTEMNNSAALAGVVESVKEARKALMERQQMFDAEMFKATYMTPVKITPEPEIDEDGNAKIAEGSQISVQVLPVKSGESKGVMMAFTDIKEFQKWDKAGEMHTLSMTMQEFVANIMKDKNLAGVSINPFGANIIVPRERMEMMLRMAASQQQARAKQKNVEVVEANINE